MYPQPKHEIGGEMNKKIPSADKDCQEIDRLLKESAELHKKIEAKLIVLRARCIVMEEK